jgi:hypothetical protein
MDKLFESLARQLFRVPEGEWINEYDCHLHQPIGQLLPSPEDTSGADTWWSLSDARLATRVADHALRGHGLPWLETVTTERDIIDLYNRSGRVAVGFNPVAPVWIALMHKASGDLVRAEQLLRDHLASDPHQHIGNISESFFRNMASATSARSKRARICRSALAAAIRDRAFWAPGYA